MTQADFEALSEQILGENKWSYDCRGNSLKGEIIVGLREAFNRGMMHASVPRDRVSVHGTDGCMNCDTGRITTYAGSRWCIECQHKKTTST